MIDFNYQTKFRLKQSKKIKSWLEEICICEKKELGELCIVFCNDEMLLDYNKKYLKHDTLTDVITFDYCVKDKVSGDILISTERVKENSKIYNENYFDGVNRVIAHGLLHLLGFKDKKEDQKKIIRKKENYYLKKLNKLIIR